MLAIAAVAAASVVLFAIPLALVVRQSYRDAEFLRLQRDAAAATRQIDLDPTLSDEVEIPESADAIGVYGRDGRRREGVGPDLADPIVLEALRTTRPANATVDGQLVVVVPLVSREQVTGVVRVSREAGAVAARVHRAWVALAALAALVLLAAGGAAVVIGRRLAGPLEELADTAGRLGEGDFTISNPPTGIREVDAVGSSLEATARRLGDMIARDRTFSADASHQLRTPLAALRIEVESMELGPNRPPEVPRALAQVDRLQATIETLLAVSRGRHPERRPLDLLPILRDLEHRWTKPLAEAHRSLRIVGATPPASAVGSDEIVREILAVLVENAVVHGAGTVRVAVSEEPPGWIAVEVSDQGPGIAAAIEDVFARAPRGGHGMGLALAQSLAEAEGARLVLAHRSPNPVFALYLRQQFETPVDASA